MRETLISRHARVKRARTEKGARPALNAADAAELWLANLRAGVSSRGTPYSPASIRNYAHHITAFAAWWGERPLAELTADDLTDHLAGARRAGAKPKSLSGREAAVRLWLDWLHGRGLLKEVSFKRVKRVAAPDPPVSALSAADVARLEAVCDRSTTIGVRDFAILRLLFGTGLRAAELCALDLEDYDRVEETLLVRHGKGDKRRTVAVPAPAVMALNEWIVLVRAEEDGPLFWNRSGLRLQPGGLRQICTRLGRAAGVAGCHPHALRHAFVLRCLEAGLDLYTTSVLMGHSSVTQTAKYARSMTASQAVAMQRRALSSLGRSSGGRN